MDSFSFALSGPIYILFKQWKIETLTGLVGSTIFIFSFAVLCECFKGLLRYYDSVCKVEDKDDTKRRYICLLLKTSYHMLNIVGSYILMLVVMTYNAWFLFAVVIGTGLAHFLTGPLILMYIGQFNDSQYLSVSSSSESVSDSLCNVHKPSRRVVRNVDERKLETSEVVSNV